MVTKYKKFYDLMISDHTALFTEFKDIHDQFATDRVKYKAQFNAIGKEVLAIVKQYENRLCGHSENTSYGKYSSTLADKFWGEVRTNYPKIDYVGIN